jgi:hypothetical protein
MRRLPSSLFLGYIVLGRETWKQRRFETGGVAVRLFDGRR